MWFLLVFFSALTFADTRSSDEKVVGVFYFKPLFGHVHQSSSRASASMTTIQCSHPVKVIESSKVSAAAEWAYVQVADHKGFILKDFLSEKRPDCIMGRYPKFFDAFNLDLSELYYWGRLNDQYLYGETRAP
ncbi:MAG TPA: hypothetical protein VNJ01_16265 [Bacteriovoracaceae bacterium]|nr:hypothetical protein [Bacteriovoracaceae bacterium]